ncbi:MAG: type II secretion system F family protein [Phycisphaerae bacterium]|nr:type II secretion system F family protein [Phycisphaerae bacterium]
MSMMIVIAVMIVVSVAMIVYALLPNRKEQDATLLRRMSGRSDNAEASSFRAPARESTTERVMKKFAPLAVKPVMPKSDEDMSRLRVRLATAGIRRENAPMMFLASKTMLGIAMTALTLVFTWSSGQDTTHVLGLTAFLGAIGFLLPDVWLWMGTKQRSEKVRNGLPDSLDLMVISVEAGLGLDAAIQRVGEEMRTAHPELSEEMVIATLETQMGVPRSEALHNMAARTGLSEMKALVAVISQAEKFGTSVAKALRNQADSMRVKRRLKAEERAQKTTVKLMLPLVLFIFPAIFVVLLGPAMLQIYRMFVKGAI